jgi:hypothetical protein
MRERIETMTKNAKHTPGPWELNGSEMTTVLDENGCYRVLVDFLEATSEDQILIAAAPDLLAACRAFVEAKAMPNQPVKPSIIAQSLRLAEAAIKKATGEE